MQNLVVVGQTVHVGIVGTNPQNWGALGQCSVGIKGVADTIKQAPPHMCYHAEFGPSTSKGVDTNGGMEGSGATMRNMVVLLNYDWQFIVSQINDGSALYKLPLPHCIA